MTLRRAQELNEMIKTSPDTYYYSFSTYSTVTEAESGKQKLVGNTNAMFYPTALIMRTMEGMTVDGIKIQGDWAVSDGVIPLASSLYPDGDSVLAKSYEEAVKYKEKIEKGVWYYMEPIFSMDHFDFCGIVDFPTTMEDFYFGLIDMVNKNSRD
jgi:triacylglycerol lipase